MPEACTDRLEALLQRFPVRARLFHAGGLSGSSDLAASGEGGQMHIVRAGALEVFHSGGGSLQVGVPSLLLYPRPLSRRFVADRQSGADLACAELQFEGGVANPIVAALPEVVCLPLADIDGASQVLQLLFDEALGEKCGRHELIDRLFEIVLIQVLRQLMESGQIQGGMLGGLSHPKLRRALVAMHERPADDWSLESLAEMSGMSRSVFAGTFREVVGCTPGVYLQGWRVRLAQQALLQGRQLKMIAVEVGYGSEAALSRAFKAQCGLTPREWRQARR